MITLPVEHLNASLRALGRSITDGECIEHAWDGELYFLLIEWPDGYRAWIGLGAEASAAIAAASRPH